MSKYDISFEYIFDEDYDPEYINGIYGGINTCGEIVANFYFERFPIPYEEVITVNEEGEIDGDEPQVIPEKKMVRRVVNNGIVMNKETAKTVYEWLGEKIKELEDE